LRGINRLYGQGAKRVKSDTIRPAGLGKSQCPSFRRGFFGSRSLDHRSLCKPRQAVRSAICSRASRTSRCLSPCERIVSPHEIRTVMMSSSVKLRHCSDRFVERRRRPRDRPVIHTARSETPALAGALFICSLSRGFLLIQTERTALRTPGTARHRIRRRIQLRSSCCIRNR
jgi:hypothetical protein